MQISFDPVKREANRIRHGLDIADAQELLSGFCVDRIDDRMDYGEERWISLGLLRGEVAVCVWADWGEVARVISLRKATRHEQQTYFEAAP